MAAHSRLARVPRGFAFLAVGAAFGLLAGTALSACSSGAATPAAATTAAATPAATAPAAAPIVAASATPKVASAAPVHYQGTFDLQPARGVAGTAVQAIGSGFAAGAHLTINWNTVHGHWLLTGSANE